MKGDERKSQAAVKEMGELKWECWTRITEPALPWASGDRWHNFWKQSPIFESWLEIKAVWFPEICVTPLKLSAPLLGTSEKCLKHTWNLTHSEWDLKNIQMGTAENLGVHFLHSSFPASKMNDCTLQKIFHKGHCWWKTAFYSEGLFTEVQFNYSFLFQKGLIVSVAWSFGCAVFPHQPDYVVSWQVRSLGLSTAAESISIILLHKTSLWGSKVDETCLLWGRPW